MKLIKTYANGRFYDTLNKKYISKEQVAALFNKKEEIKIIMHNTDSDVTESVMERLAPLLNIKKESKLNIDNIKNWVSDQVDRRIEMALTLINLPTRDQIGRLTADIEKLTQKVDRLQNRLAKTKTPAEPRQTVLSVETPKTDLDVEPPPTVPEETDHGQV
jgi:hypothetical protein